MRTSTMLISLAALTTAHLNPEKRQTTDAASSQASLLSSAVSQLISLYIPTSVYPALSSAASAHTLTGDVASLLLSGLTATSPPAWLTAVPTQYSANIASLESRVSELRSVVSVGSISGAPRVVTSTGTGGVVEVTTVPAGGSGAGSASSTGSGGGTTGSTTTSAESTTVLTGTKSKTSSGASTQATSSTSASKTSSGFAMASEVPGAIMGVAGLLGLVAAL